MNYKKILVVFISLFLIIFTIVACAQPQQRPGPDNRTNNGDNRNIPEQTRIIPRRVTPRDSQRNNDLNGFNAPNRTDNNNADDLDNRVDNNRYVDRAERIADRVASLREIESSTCIITGNTAMIGVQFSDQYKGKMTNAIKEKCEEIVKNTDKDIKRVVVTADPDIYSRMTTMLKDISKGKPLSGFAKEMNELLNRIQPK